eukprot:CAMPEP_0184540162 /NCGR_PEP_ID=MMETSP0198_2-20121128/18506_1 /TAXON_ID=1112570 /ORGANISM="Thraustochytrium sp., Strain LLF1b" /LENGTH=281 /DNA_ID=CAMNT_0026933713 /DNA_START=42 /DNA_END=884 /DNA_ORIENTATION=-
MAPLAATHVIVRHGARTPSEAALRRLADTPMAEQWKECKTGRLTDVGLRQSQELGHALAGTSEFEGLKRGGNLLWNSSKMQRVVDSGAAFVRGLATGGALQEDAATSYCERGPTPIDSMDPDHYFCAFSSNQAYVDAMHEHRLGADSCTYLKELEECEHFFTNPERSALREAFLPEARKEIAELARWSWDQRFFRHTASADLGKPLLKVIESRADASPDDVFVYSAHDYTIMSLLKALHPDSSLPCVMSFSTYLIIQGNKVTLNPAPFDGPQGKFSDAAAF